MAFEDILKEGLDKVLCIVRDLPSYSAKKLKQEEFQIIKYDIDFILFQLQEYLKNLPKPGIRLLPSHRIVIYNARLIFQGISILFDVHIKYITRLYTNWIKDWERQLSNGVLADDRKPKAKTAKKKQIQAITGVVEIKDSVEQPEAVGSHLRLEEAAKESFFDDGKTPADLVDRDAAFERDFRLLSELAPGTDLPAPELLRMPEGLSELTHRRPETYSLDLRRSQVKLSLPQVGHQLFDASHPLLQPTLVGEPMEIEISQIPRILQKSSEQLAVDFDMIIQKIGESSIEHRSKGRAKSSKSIFRIRPTMTTEEYEKILNRGKKVADPIKYYTIRKDGSVDPRFIQCSVTELMEEVIIDHGLDLSGQLKQNVSQPVIPPYLRGQHFRKSVSGMIPEFELPSMEHTEIRLDAPRPEFLERSMTDHDTGRTITEQQLGLSSLNDVENVVSISHLDGTEDIESHLSFLMNGLSLHHIHRTPTPLPFEVSQLPDIEQIMPIPSPQRPADEGLPRIQKTPQQSRLETVEEILIQITEKCLENSSPFIRFTDICSLSETRFAAANVFGRLLELWWKKQINLLQNSSHPNDIFITLME